MKALLRIRRIAVWSFAVLLLLSGCGLGFALSDAFDANTGPGMIVTYTSAIRDVSIIIRSSTLPDGSEFPNGGAIGFPSYPLGGATMGAAPDGRHLPEWIDFTWTESPDSDAVPVPIQVPVQTKRQRVFIRSRVPQEVIDKVEEAKRHLIAGYGSEKKLEIFFIWTTDGIKLRWNIWNTPRFNLQYDSRVGGDEFIPTGTTMIVAYASSIRAGVVAVNTITRYPEIPGRSFSGASGFSFAERPVLPASTIVAHENAERLPEAVQFDWRLFQVPIPRKWREADADYKKRTQALADALPVRRERVEIMNRIPEPVRDKIRDAARHAVPAKPASYVIFLYFIWTDQGIKLRWRLMETRDHGPAVEVQAGGDVLSPPEP